MIDAALQKELRERFNPDGSRLRAVQMRLYDLLCKFDDFCSANGIKYWLDSGTLIGAVRHGGFIPWDDDVDVMMLREDWEKLQAVFKETDDLFLQTMDTEPYYVHIFAKFRDKHTWVQERFPRHYRVNGVYLDIFVIDRAYPKFVSQRCKQHNLYLNKLANRVKTLTPYGAFRIKFWRSWFRFNVALCSFLFRPFRSKEYLRILPGCPFYKHLYKPEWVAQTVPMMFEGREFPVPVAYDAYLTRLYGDWNSLPDLDKILVHLEDFREES